MVSAMPQVDQLTILAPGLIGGSLGKAIKRHGFARRVVGWGRRETSLQAALQCGAIDQYHLNLASAIQGSDIVVMATPPRATAALLPQLADVVHSDTIITDVTSVKGHVLRAARAAFGAIPPNLVLGHPIAGSERQGIQAAQENLFDGHWVILTPSHETSVRALERVTALWESTGAMVTTLSVDVHDEYLAASSHLPHLLAFAFIDALSNHAQKSEVFRFTGGGFRDFTRIASSDPHLWQEIMLTNDKAIIPAIDQVMQQLSVLRDAIESGDAATLTHCFERAKSVRDRLVGDRVCNT